jgi:hypothetical protein
MRLLSFDTTVVVNFENITEAETKRDVKKQVTKQMIIKTQSMKPLRQFSGKAIHMLEL